MENVLKEFVVALGFAIDEKGKKNFDHTLKNIADSAVKLSAAIIGASTAISAFTLKISSGLDQLYYTAKNTGSSVENLEKMMFGFSQVGLSADTALSSIRSLSSFLDSAPNASNLLNRIGVKTHDVNGHMRDTSNILSDLLNKLAKMPIYQAMAYGQIFGIDEETIKRTRNGIGGFTKEYKEMLKATGYNSNHAASQANEFMMRYRKLGTVFDILKNKIGGNLAESLSGKMEKFTKLILDNFPKIESVITKVLTLIIRLTMRGIELIGDIINLYRSLDKSTQDTIKVIGALAFAIWALSSPLLLISGLLIGLLFLYDDYKNWKEGKKSLIDWKEIKWFDNLEEKIDNLKLALEIFAAYFAGKFMLTIVRAVASMTTSVAGLVTSLASIATSSAGIAAIGLLYSPSLNEGEDEIVSKMHHDTFKEMGLSDKNGNIDVQRFNELINKFTNNNPGVTVNQTNNINITTTGETGREVVEIIENQANRNLQQMNNIKVTHE